MTNWFAVSMGNDGVTKQTCRAPQKDMSMLTVFLSYRPMIAYTPLENWEQTVRDERRKHRERGHGGKLVPGLIKGLWNICIQLKVKNSAVRVSQNETNVTYSHSEHTLMHKKET